MPRFGTVWGVIDFIRLLKYITTTTIKIIRIITQIELLSKFAFIVLIFDIISEDGLIYIYCVDGNSCPCVRCRSRFGCGRRFGIPCGIPVFALRRDSKCSVR